MWNFCKNLKKSPGAISEIIPAGTFEGIRGHISDGTTEAILKLKTLAGISAGTAEGVSQEILGGTCEIISKGMSVEFKEKK